MNSSANEKPAKSSLQWVTGTIKMYREKDGYGFITDGTNEYYFNVHSLQGEIIPRPGMKCEFIPVPARKPGQKPVAKGMVITSTADAEPPRDSRIKCPSCGRLITPRLVTYGGKPSRSYCPFCGGLVKDFTTKCFIATAVYGDPLHPAVIALRRFRNEVLLTNLPGRLLVKAYYRLSPPVAEFAKKHPALGKTVKPLLDRLAALYGF